MPDPAATSEFEGHTPGEWVASSLLPRGMNTERLCSLRVKGTKASVGSVLLSAPYPADDITAEANARLIAAAPDLLRQRDELVGVLKYIRGVCLTAQPRNEDGAGEGIIDTITEALAAVEGK